MADDKTNRGPADRARINIHESYEVEYWSKELGVSPDRLRELVAKLSQENGGFSVRVPLRPLFMRNPLILLLLAATAAYAGTMLAL